MTSPMIDLKSLTCGQLAALVHKAGGAENVDKILRGDLNMTIAEPDHVLRCDESFDLLNIFHSPRCSDDKLTSWRGPLDGGGLEGAVDHDERSLSIRQINWTNVKFCKYLRDRETSITVQDQIERQKETGQILLGENVFLSLWLDELANKEKSVLHWLHRNRNVCHLMFPGLILRHVDGFPCVRALNYRGCWHLGYLWLRSLYVPVLGVLE